MRMIRTGIFAGVFGVLCGVATPIFGDDIFNKKAETMTDETIILAQTDTGFDAWVKDFRVVALKNNITPAVYDAAFRGVRLNKKVLKSDGNQAEFTLQIWDYLDRAVSPIRVEQGREKHAEFADILSQIVARFGVPAPIILAVWGLESSYGARMGDIDTIEALATLAYDGRRGEFARGQLLAALKIWQNGDNGTERIIGSWAGAMGHTQFIPTSYEAYAVDFIGDGARNIWSRTDPTDALASTANYLAEHGWNANRPWGVEVRLPAGFDYGKADLKTKLSAKRWAKLGVVLATGEDLPKANWGKMAMFLPAGAKGPAFLVTANFFVIKRYNNANAYALAVGHLSDRLAGGGEVIAAWPRDLNALSYAEQRELQEQLIRLGFDLGEVDGIIGEQTRQAIRAFQKSVGQVADGMDSQELLDILKKAR